MSLHLLISLAGQFLKILRNSPFFPKSRKNRKEDILNPHAQSTEIQNSANLVSVLDAIQKYFIY